MFKLRSSDKSGINPEATYNKMKILTWNIEGLKAQVFTLVDVTLEYLPDLIFISEPQVFRTTAGSLMDYLNHEYLSH